MEYVSGADTGQYQHDAFGVLFHSMPTAGLLVLDQSDQILDSNGAFKQLFGWDSQALQGLQDAKFPLWPNAAGRRQWLARLASGQSPVTVELPLRCRNGSLLPCSLIIESISLADQPHRLYLFQPISRLQRNNRLIQTNTLSATLPDNDSLALALDASRMGIWELDIRSGLLNASARSAALHALRQMHGKAHSEPLWERYSKKINAPCVARSLPSAVDADAVIALPTESGNLMAALDGWKQPHAWTGTLRTPPCD